MKLLLIEDEAPAAERLKKLLEKIRPEAKILATIDSIEDTVAFLKHNPAPDLIFMDINLADGLSLEIAKQIKIPAPVIFVTAYNQYALEAFRANGIAYLLKPIDENELEDAFQKWENLRQNPTLNLDILSKAFAQPSVQYKERFIVKTGSKMSFVPVTDIAAFLSESGTTFLVTKSDKRYLSDLSLDELVGLLDPKLFFRVSRKYIVSVSSVDQIEPHLNGRLLLTSAPDLGEAVYVSRHRARDFKAWLDL